MFIRLYFISLPIFVTLDALWVGVIAKGFYAKYIGFLFRRDVNWVAVILFYLLIVVGLVYFVINPALEKKSWSYALYSGALFGLVSYATYDLTNLATIKNWPYVVTFIDLVWGSIIAGSVSVITYIIAKKLGL
jgi:uncharacterized membrane protein